MRSVLFYALLSALAVCTLAGSDSSTPDAVVPEDTTPVPATTEIAVPEPAQALLETPGVQQQPDKSDEAMAAEMYRERLTQPVPSLHHLTVKQVASPQEVAAPVKMITAETDNEETTVAVTPSTTETTHTAAIVSETPAECEAMSAASCITTLGCHLNPKTNECKSGDGVAVDGPTGPSHQIPATTFRPQDTISQGTPSGFGSGVAPPAPEADATLMPTPEHENATETSAAPLEPHWPKFDPRHKWEKALEYTADQHKFVENNAINLKAYAITAVHRAFRVMKMNTRTLSSLGYLVVALAGYGGGATRDQCWPGADEQRTVTERAEDIFNMNFKDAETYEGRGAMQDLGAQFEKVMGMVAKRFRWSHKGSLGPYVLRHVAKAMGTPKGALKTAHAKVSVDSSALGLDSDLKVLTDQLAVPYSEFYANVMKLEKDPCFHKYYDLPFTTQEKEQAELEKQQERTYKGDSERTYKENQAKAKLQEVQHKSDVAKAAEVSAKAAEEKKKKAEVESKEGAEKAAQAKIEARNAMIEAAEKKKAAVKEAATKRDQEVTAKATAASLLADAEEAKSKQSDEQNTKESDAKSKAAELQVKAQAEEVSSKNSAKAAAEQSKKFDVKEKTHKRRNKLEVQTKISEVAAKKAVEEKRGKAIEAETLYKYDAKEKAKKAFVVARKEKADKAAYAAAKKEVADKADAAEKLDKAHTREMNKLAAEELSSKTSQETDTKEKGAKEVTAKKTEEKDTKEKVDLNKRETVQKAETEKAGKEITAKAGKEMTAKTEAEQVKEQSHKDDAAEKAQKATARNAREVTAKASEGAAKAKTATELRAKKAAVSVEKQAKAAKEASFKKTEAEKKVKLEEAKELKKKAGADIKEAEAKEAEHEVALKAAGKKKDAAAKEATNKKTEEKDTKEKADKKKKESVEKAGTEKAGKEITAKALSKELLKKGGEEKADKVDAELKAKAKADKEVKAKTGEKKAKTEAKEAAVKVAKAEEARKKADEAAKKKETVEKKAAAKAAKAKAKAEAAAKKKKEAAVKAHAKETGEKEAVAKVEVKQKKKEQKKKAAVVEKSKKAEKLVKESDKKAEEKSTKETQYKEGNAKEAARESSAKRRIQCAVSGPGVTAGKAQGCVFPFMFDGKQHSSCISGGQQGTRKWCAIATSREGYFLSEKWGYCGPCPLTNNATGNATNAMIFSYAIKVTTGTLKNAATTMLPRITLKGSKGVEFELSSMTLPAEGATRIIPFYTTKDIGTVEQVQLLSTSTDAWMFTKFQVQTGFYGHWVPFGPVNFWLLDRPYKEGPYPGDGHGDSLLLDPQAALAILPTCANDATKAASLALRGHATVEELQGQCNPWSLGEASNGDFAFYYKGSPALVITKAGELWSSNEGNGGFLSSGEKLKKPPSSGLPQAGTAMAAGDWAVGESSTGEFGFWRHTGGHFQANMFVDKNAGDTFMGESPRSPLKSQGASGSLDVGLPRDNAASEMSLGGWQMGVPTGGVDKLGIWKGGILKFMVTKTGKVWTEGSDGFIAAESFSTIHPGKLAQGISSATFA